MNPLRVLHLSATDSGGGAARAAYRLHHALVNLGVDSKMLVGQKLSQDSTVYECGVGKADRFRAYLWPYLDSLPRRLYPHRPDLPYSAGSFSYCNLRRHALVQEADVICLYWINGGFLKPEDLRGIAKPILWRLSDMWPFTGGCHYAGECVRYERHCGRCPVLGSRSEWDLSRWLWRRKERSWRELNITIAAPSRWIADCAARSSLFAGRRIEIVPTGIDLQKFRPVDRGIARSLLALPQEKTLILFVSGDVKEDTRKGYAFLVAALRELAAQPEADRYHAVVVGALDPSDERTLPLKASVLGRLSDDISLSLVYSACDVMACPSLQDNLPNTALEAIACGTPVVAFSVGGLSDIVDHAENGYLAKPADANDLAQGMLWILADEKRRQRLAAAARAKAERCFSMEVQVNRYVMLYQELVDSESRAIRKAAPAWSNE